MSRLVQKLRKFKLLNAIFDELYTVKLWKRNWNAKSIIDRETKNSYKILKDVDVKANNIFFLGIPRHNNMGDQAQRYCIELWLKKNYPDSNIIALPTWPFYNRKFRTWIDKFIKEADLIVFQSGYCTTDRHYDHWMHRYIVKKYKNNAILIMPQTVNFIIPRKGYNTGKLYGAHKKLLFLARDKKSYALAKKYFTDTKILLYPDIVTTLIGTCSFEEEREGILLCIRNDGEKKYSNQQIKALMDRFHQKEIPCEISDTNSELPLDELISKFDLELNSLLRFFAKHRVIITDRYHGTIFSMISNTPVIVLATNDHKVKTGTEWFREIYDGAYYNADSIDEAYSLALRILSENVTLNNASYFNAQYYNKLKKEVDELTWEK